jgi:hypothetical protein
MDKEFKRFIIDHGLHELYIKACIQETNDAIKETNRNLEELRNTQEPVIFPFDFILPAEEDPGDWWKK